MIDITKLDMISCERKERRVGYQIEVTLLYDDLIWIDIIYKDLPDRLSFPETEVKFALKTGQALIPDSEFLNCEKRAKLYQSKEDYESETFEPKFKLSESYLPVKYSDIDEFCKNTLISRDLTEYVRTHVDTLLKGEITE